MSSFSQIHIFVVYTETVMILIKKTAVFKAPQNTFDVETNGPKHKKF